ncbi:MAG TPA: hypothetical protein VK612_04895 [Pyrinomonadaceae bacterium]|nr:hypothetical protein [Pyrinomonadaceae bacterium]
MRIPIALFVLLSIATFVSAQKTEVTISLSEQFFDAALDAVFQHGGPLEFSIAMENGKRKVENEEMKSEFSVINFPLSDEPRLSAECSETIKLLRETNGVRTSVRFRDGKILAPLAFSGNYNPPFIGCVPFSGWAESTIDLEFDQASQRLIAKARVLNVSLNGTGGVGGSVIAKLVQSSIDKKINPIELFRLDKLSFPLPLKGAEGLQMKAVGIRHVLQNGAINIIVSYEFVK